MTEKYYSINKNACSIRCKLYCAEKAELTSAVIFGHGFAGHKDNRAARKLAERIQKRHPQTALVCFDWPCHGEDAGTRLTLDGCMRYLGAVLEDAQDRLGARALYGCAVSFGGYLFLRYLAAHGDAFRALALRSPAIPMYDSLTRNVLSERELAQLQKGKPALVGFDRKVRLTREFLEELREADLTKLDFRPFSEKLVILHGTKDELIPLDAVQTFAERNEIPFFPVEGADHRFSDPKRTDEAIEIILAALFEP